MYYYISYIHKYIFENNVPTNNIIRIDFEEIKNLSIYVPVELYNGYEIKRNGFNLIGIEMNDLLKINIGEFLNRLN